MNELMLEGNMQWWSEGCKDQDGVAPRSGLARVHLSIASGRAAWRTSSVFGSPSASAMVLTCYLRWAPSRACHETSEDAQLGKLEWPFCVVCAEES